MHDQKEIINIEDKPRSKFKVLMSLLGIFFCALYLLNMTAGFIEIFPDNLPIVGNIDEVMVSGIFYGCLRYLGLDVVPFKRR
jgi:hypothetical protein